MGTPIQVLGIGICCRGQVLRLEMAGGGSQHIPVWVHCELAKVLCVSASLLRPPAELLLMCCEHAAETKLVFNPVTTAHMDWRN